MMAVNSLIPVSEVTSKFNSESGYDFMTQQEKYFLNDVENLVDSFHKTTSFDIRESDYK